jgi:hypothetical protein
VVKDGSLALPKVSRNEWERAEADEGTRRPAPNRTPKTRLKRIDNAPESSFT